MAEDNKVIFSMVGVGKTIPPQKKILNNIYLSFFYGAKIGILGLNGAGKSTLMKIIFAGFAAQSDGNFFAVGNVSANGSVPFAWLDSFG